jgi:hypothetical protein
MSGPALRDVDQFGVPTQPRSIKLHQLLHRYWPQSSLHNRSEIHIPHAPTPKKDIFAPYCDTPKNAPSHLSDFIFAPFAFILHFIN